MAIALYIKIKNMHKKLILLTCLLVSTVTFSQVVTSKKAAERKGIYQKPSTEKAVVTSNNDKKYRTIAKPLSIKSLKSLLNEKGGEDIEPTTTDNYIAVQMINNAMEFMGVKYRTGGTSKAGMDCSGMVTAVFNIFDKSIPRSSRDMAQVGQKVADKEVQKGDLIFFKTNGRSSINHVGLVIGTDAEGIQFIHSSTSQGVIVSSTKEAYYKKAFAQVNRVL